MEKKQIEKLPGFVNVIRDMRETIITNILLIGQTPSPTFKEKRRAKIFMERLMEFNVDEVTTDGYRNPIGIIRGKDKEKPPIFVVAHMDTNFAKDVDHNYTVGKNSITGAGIIDNSISVGVLASLPEIINKLGLRFESDIVLAGVIQSLGKGNLRGIRHLIKTWSTPIRGAVCIEGGELGRLNYNSDGMVRCEIVCNVSSQDGYDHRFEPNAILILNDIINQILRMRLPQRPRSRIIIGKIAGGFLHGKIATEAMLGLEIQSDSDKVVKSILADVTDVVDGVGHEFHVDINLNIISTLYAASLKYNHRLVKNAVAVMKALDLKPVSAPTESELSIFLSKNISAVTLGVTRGEKYQKKESRVEIEPIFTGIAQIIGVMMAVDSGVCDEYGLA